MGLGFRVVHWRQDDPYIAHIYIYILYLDNLGIGQMVKHLHNMVGSND